MAAEIQGSSEDPQQTCALRKSTCGDSHSGQHRLTATLTSMIGKPTKRAEGKLSTTSVSDLEHLDKVPPPGINLRAGNSEQSPRNRCFCFAIKIKRYL